MTAGNHLSNWGRWGDDDERGTLNYIDPGAIAEAARLITTGRVYHLAIPVTAAHSSPMRDGALRTTTVRHDPTASRRQIAIDVLAIHTHDFTHLDALAHIGYADSLFNGVPLDTVTDRGAAQLSVDRIGSIIGRAILADVAGALGVTHLEAGHVIEADDLDRALASQRTTVRRGDILLVRTGWIVPYMKDRSIALAGWPGLGISALEWLHAHEITAVGADNLAVEVRPFEDDNRSLPIHECFIRDMGGYLMEFLDLEELSRDGVREMFFAAVPLRLQGGLGSPVTPIAIV